MEKLFSSSLACGLGYLAVAAAIAAFVVVDSLEQPERLMSGVGVISFLAFGFLFSAHPGHIHWRHVVWGVSLQFIFGLAVLRWDVSNDE